MKRELVTDRHTDIMPYDSTYLASIYQRRMIERERPLAQPRGARPSPKLGSQENSWLRRCPMAGQKKNFFVKIEGLSSFT